MLVLTRDQQVLEYLAGKILLPVKDPLDQDCVQTFNQLKASINGLKSFGEAYMSEHLEECLKQEVEIKEIMQKLKPVMQSIFKL